ncbi:MAG TPA: hypothetical protein VGO68_13410 [Pyrinomonadaceae bacterium]|nr:hypothetical protein [Pyrinomonadaceae bacterium]
MNLLGSLCLAQETVPGERKLPSVELITMEGGKPNLSASGEGIISIKTTDLFLRGATHAKLIEPTFPIELPVGYTLFNKLIYQLDSKAVASGPSDFVFQITSATTKETFDKLRILYAERDSADPEKPRWIDATLIPGLKEALGRYLTRADFDKRRPDFLTHTLHAFMEQDPAILIVASKDSALARDHFVADVSITGTVPEEVMVGRTVIYDLKLMNHGPDTATSILLHADPTFNLIAATASQGKCRMEASNVYCNLASLEKGKSITVRIEEMCRWDEYHAEHNFPQGKTIQVSSAEGDSDLENNLLTLSTGINDDPNQAPVAEFVSPREDEVFTGADTTVSIVFKASDPDGFVDNIEVFDWGKPIGKATLLDKDQYRLAFEKASLGTHRLEAIVTDNLGRETRVGAHNFLVNGLAKVEISDPKPYSLLDGQQGELSVTILASHPTLGIKEVKVYLRALGPGYGEAIAKPVGNDVYVAKVDCSFCDCDVVLSAVVIDDSGAQTRSKRVPLKLKRTPIVRLYHNQGKKMSRLEPDQPAELSAGETLVASLEQDRFEGLNLAKMELYANGKLTDSYVASDSSGPTSRNIEWDLAGLEPGRYRIQIVATDTDGTITRSDVVEIVIKKK